MPRYFHGFASLKGGTLFDEYIVYAFLMGCSDSCVGMKLSSTSSIVTVDLASGDKSCQSLLACIKQRGINDLSERESRQLHPSKVFKCHQEMQMLRRPDTLANRDSVISRPGLSDATPPEGQFAYYILCANLVRCSDCRTRYPNAG